MKNWAKKTISILILVMMVCLVITGDSQEELFKNKWIAGIDAIEEKLSATPGVYENITSQELAEMFQQLKADVNSGLNDEKTIFIRLKEIIAACQHLHMGIDYVDTTALMDFHFYPFYYDWEREGLVITTSVQEYAECVGAVVKTICGLSVDEFVDKLGNLRSYETLTGKRNSVTDLFYSEELAYLEIIEDASDILVLELEKDDKEFTIEVEPIRIADASNMEIASIWQTADSSKLPFRYRVIGNMEFSGHNTYYEADMDNGVMLLEYSSCMEEPEYFFECFDHMIKEMRENNDILDTLVIDVSSNGGGSRLLLQNKLTEYKFYLLTKNVKLIIGNKTASAAVHAVEDALSLFPTVETYGSPTAGAIYNYTEINFCEFPEINLEIWFPTEFDSLPYLTEKFGPVKDSVYPDHEVMVSYSELMQGKDAVYDAIVGK